MELMDTSLDKFYKFIYERLKERIPESILGKVTVAVSRIFRFLRTKKTFIIFLRTCAYAIFNHLPLSVLEKLQFIKFLLLWTLTPSSVLNQKLILDSASEKSYFRWSTGITMDDMSLESVLEHQKTNFRGKSCGTFSY